MKYVIYLLVLFSMATNADIDWYDKEGSLPYISMSMIENFIGMKEYCAGIVEGDYSKIEKTISTLKQYHYELFPKSTATADPSSRNIFSDQIKNESDKEIASICFSVQKDVMVPTSISEYFKLLSKSFDETKALIDS